MQMTIDLLAVAAVISAVSAGAGVLSAHALSKKQKRDEVAGLVRSVILEHQATCPVGEQLRSDANRDRQEMLAAIGSLRTEVSNGIRDLNNRLDAIYLRMRNSED
jgi:hypothetical protein